MGAAAVIDGEIIIYEDDVEKAYDLRQMAYRLNREYIETNADYTDEERSLYLERLEKPETKEMILENMIQNAVILTEAEKLGLTADLTEAEELYDNNLKLFYEADDSDKGTALARRVLEEYIESQNMTGEEYRSSVGVPIYRDSLTQRELRKYFEQTADKQGAFGANTYDEYVIKLKESHTIEYFD